MQPATTALKLGAITPSISNAYICPSATVVGKVSVGAKSSVWYGAVIRGDTDSISIGEGVTIGDRTVIHCSEGSPTKVGDNVVVSSGSIIHGSTIGSNCFIGEGSQLLDGVKMGSNSMVAAGSLVGTGKNIPAGQLWSGMPAKYERDLIPEEIEKITASAMESVALAKEHIVENAKTWQVIEEDAFVYDQEAGRSDYYYKRLTPEVINTFLLSLSPSLSLHIYMYIHPSLSPSIYI